MKKRTDEEYIQYDPFEGDRDVNIRCQQVRMVTVRKSHKCVGLEPNNPHTIEPGSRARYESAIVDGKWGNYYMCIPCMDEWLESIGE